MGFSWVTLTAILPVCGQVTAFHSSKEIHAQILKSANRPDIFALNSLMDMYVRCGAIDYCRRVFYRMQSKDLTSWNIMLTGYALNGFMEEAMELFDEIVNSDIKPDGITFIALLSGCSHAGLIDEGQRFFSKMKLDYGISSTVEHYTCLIDILGRAGRIKKALRVVENMPMKPSTTIRGLLLNSYWLHGNVSLGELIAEQLCELEPNNPRNYIMLSNIYASAEMWEGVKMVRDMMEKRGIKKEAGCSWTQIKTEFTHLWQVVGSNSVIHLSLRRFGMN